MATQVSGITLFTIDNQSFDVANEITYDANILTREPIPNFSRKNLFGETPKMASIEVKIVDTGYIKQYFMSLLDVTVSVQCANNYNLVISDAVCFEWSAVSVSPETSTFTVKFMGYDANESGV